MATSESTDADLQEYESFDRKNISRMRVGSILVLFTCEIACTAVTPEDRLRYLDSVISAQYEEYEDLKSRISLLEEKVAGLKAERNGQENLQQADGTFGDDVQSLELSSQIAMEHVSKRQSYQPVAFHAYMNTNKCYTIHTHFAFDNVPLDVGGGLAHDTSTFDVPEDGVYVLTWTVTVPQGNEKVVTELVLNFRAVLGVLVSDTDYVYPGTGAGTHPATGVVVTKLRRRDLVHIEVTHPSASCGHILGSDTLVRTTFSGWKLFDLQ